MKWVKKNAFCIKLYFLPPEKHTHIWPTKLNECKLQHLSRFKTMDDQKLLTLQAFISEIDEDVLTIHNDQNTDDVTRYLCTLALESDEHVKKMLQTGEVDREQMLAVIIDTIEILKRKIGHVRAVCVNQMQKKCKAYNKFFESFLKSQEGRAVHVSPAQCPSLTKPVVYRVVQKPNVKITEDKLRMFVQNECNYDPTATDLFVSKFKEFCTENAKEVVQKRKDDSINSAYTFPTQDVRLT